VDVDVQLPSGRIRARRWGADGAPLLLCVHGLSANLCSFTDLAQRLAGNDRQVVAIDLRGRGRSEVTPPGTYGLENHARDVLGVATALRAAEFDLVGWSLGALIVVAVATTLAVIVLGLWLRRTRRVQRELKAVRKGASVAASPHHSGKLQWRMSG